jgi:hypothetical protein
MALQQSAPSHLFGLSRCMRNTRAACARAMAALSIFKARPIGFMRRSTGALFFSALD